MATTVQDIIDFMKSGKYHFTRRFGGFIRADDPDNLLTTFCPITGYVYAKTGRYFRMLDYYVAASEVGLPESDAVDIALSADDGGIYREQMLEAIGATEEEK